MDPTARVEAYYEALREDDPLAPFFVESDDLVKVGISERLVGYEQVEVALRSQTNSTQDWVVDSRDLRVSDRGDCAWFSDEVLMEWTDTHSGTRHRFDSRWSGTLVNGDETDGQWEFVGLHVSAPHEL